MKKRLIVCGGRTYGYHVERDRPIKHPEELAVIEWALTEWLPTIDGFGPNETTLVHGAAHGADSAAAKIAGGLGFEPEPHPASWDLHGRAAGPIRNKEMLDAGADMVMAFPGGRGTAGMMAIAIKAGVPTYRVLAIGQVETH